jgi:hypothetical protein
VESVTENPVTQRRPIGTAAELSAPFVIRLPSMSGYFFRRTRRAPSVKFNSDWHEPAVITAIDLQEITGRQPFTRYYVQNGMHLGYAQHYRFDFTF